MRGIDGDKITVFQSTAPVWGPTSTAADLVLMRSISIHGPRVGADSKMVSTTLSLIQFQSTAPVWGPTPHKKRLESP